MIMIGYYKEINMEQIIKRLIESRRIDEEYTIVRVRRITKDSYNNYQYLLKDTKSTFKYGLAKSPQSIQKFSSKVEALDRLDDIIKNDDYIYKVITI